MIVAKQLINCEKIVVKAQLGKRASILRQNPSISVGAYLGMSV